MKLKSLLLGSSAALVAVSGARAADAIIIEPEPVEYVRVCDAYGAGFYYIPGTETCLSINGYIWFQLGFTSQDDGFTDNYYGSFEGDQYNTYIRARVNFDARTETEWGTLRSYIRFQADEYNTFPTADDGVALDQGFIEIAGFRMGYTESAYVTSPAAGYGQFGSYSYYGLNYAYSQRVLLQYNYVANGFGAGISLEDDATGDYTPDIVGTLSYTTAAWGAWAKVGYDEEDVTGAGSAWGAQVGAQVNFGQAHNFKLVGYYADYDDALPGGLAGTSNYSVGGEWSVLAAYRFTASEQLSFNLGAQYIWDTNHDAAGSDDAFIVEGEVNWTPVAQFEVKTGIAYSSYDAATGDEDTVGGFVRFTRSF